MGRQKASEDQMHTCMGAWVAACRDTATVFGCFCRMPIMQLHVASLASALNLGYFTWIVPGCFFRHEMSDCYSYGYQSTVFEL